MIVSVIIRPRNGLVSTATAAFGWEALVNGEVILAYDQADAINKAQTRERELGALPEPRSLTGVETVFGPMEYEDRLRIAAIFRETAKADTAAFMDSYSARMFDDERVSMGQRERLYDRIADWFEGK